MPKGQRLQAARENSDFNLSFLDIMACGLGAVILIFLLVKHNDDRGVVESEILSRQLETLEQDVQKFRVLVEQSAQRNSDVKKLGSELDDQSESSKTVLAALDDRITQQQNENARLQDSIKETQDKKAADFVEGPSGGEDNYLLGLKVEGPRIAILIDSSASMTAEALVDVFRYKVSSPQERSSAPKWLRTKRTARWLLNRVPAASSVSVVEFGDQARFLNTGSTNGSGDWFKLQDTTQLSTTVANIDKLVPDGPTNLQGAFEALATLSPAPTHVYVITDGLPTKVTGRGPRCARNDVISPECRLQLFDDMIGATRSQLASMQLNVVLLPLEGDWAAANAYWNLAVATGGLMISPPQSWP